MTKDRAAHLLDKAVEYLLYIVIFYIPISKAIIEVAFASAAVLFIIKIIIKPDVKFLKSSVYLLLLLFIFFNALSLINSGVYLHKSLEAFFLKWSEYVFIFVVTANTLNTRRRLKNALVVMLAISALVGIDAIFQHFAGWDFLRVRPLIGRRVTAGFENQNTLAAYLVIMLLITIPLLFQKMRKGYKVCLFSLLVFLITSLVLTFSRSSWLAFFIGFMFMAVLFAPIRKYIPILGLLIFAVLLIPSVHQRMFTVFLPGGDSARISLSFTALRMINENPFLGKGVGTFMANFTRYAEIPGIYYAHNCFLQIWAETGIFTLLVFLYLVGSLIEKAIKAFRRNSNIFLLGSICGLTGFLVHSFFDTSLYVLQLSFFFWLMLGILSALSNLETNLAK